MGGEPTGRPTTLRPVARLDSLPPDQRAVLQLVLRQGRAYDDLAGVLKIPGEAVRQRALLGGETLVPPSDDVTVEDGEDVVDYLLSQPGADVSKVSPAGLRWGRDLSRELDPIAPEGLPDLPEAPRARGRGIRGAAAAVAARGARREEVDDGGSADVDGRPPRGADGPTDGGAGEGIGRSSRLGGALLLVGLGIFIAALVILLVNRDDNNSKSSSG